VHRLAGLALLLTVVAAAGAAPAPASAATAAPSKLAVVVMENRPYSTVAKKFPYVDSTIRAEGITIVPSPTGCNYPAGDPQGTGTLACTAGMFQSYRDAAGYRTKTSGPEYAFMSMGSDANVLDGKFPNSLNTATGINQGVVGYTPSTPTAVYNVFDAAEAGGVPFTVYAEDYPGSTTTCSTVKFSDGLAKSNFYARRHNPFLLTWDQTPDARVVAGVTPAAPPSPSACEAHMSDFPGNTPNGSTAVVQNFTGGESLGALTIIVPSMCHSGHNAESACGTGQGGIPGADNWLRANFQAIRQDVGPNGVVVLTWDEAGPGVDGQGKVPPIALYVVPGADAQGAPGTLAGCGTPPCALSDGIYDQASTVRTLLDQVGASCAALDATVTYQRQPGPAQALCTAARPLPVAISQ
jgi:hypothetical protein